MNLCLSPLIVTAALTCLIQDQPVSWVSALTVTYSGMMLMTVCSDDGSCYISFKDAAFNVAFTAFYGIYLIKLAQSLSEVSAPYIHVIIIIIIIYFLYSAIYNNRSVALYNSINIMILKFNLKSNY